MEISYAVESKHAGFFFEFEGEVPGLGDEVEEMFGGGFLLGSGGGDVGLEGFEDEEGDGRELGGGCCGRALGVGCRGVF